MFVLDDLGTNSERCAVIEDYQISIVTGRYAALPALHTGEQRWPCSHPIHNFSEGKTALAGLSPDQRQAKLQGGYTAPGLFQITAVQMFQLRCTRRVVRNYKFDSALRQALPQRRSIFILANGWAALIKRFAIGTRFGKQGQVMWTGLGGYINPGGSGLLYSW